MARVTALVPDLMLGSRVVELLQAAGHEVELITSEPEAWDQIAGTDVLVVDLTSEAVDGVVLVDTLLSGGEMEGTRTLGLYAHVDAGTRQRALAAGFDQVVPRSRMVREGGDIVSRLAAQ